MLDDDVDYDEDGFEHIVNPEEEESVSDSSDNESEYSFLGGFDSNVDNDKNGVVSNDEETAAVVAKEDTGVLSEIPSNQPRIVSELGSNLGDY